MKVVFIILNIFLLSACDVGSSKANSKEDSNGRDVSRPPITQQKLDSDFDGVDDETEVEFGQDPIVSNFPVISIAKSNKARIRSKFTIESSTDTQNIDTDYLNKEYEFRKGEYKGLGVLIRNSVVYNKISGLIYSEIFDRNSNLELIPTLKDSLLGEFGCISSVNFFKKHDDIRFKRGENEYFSNTLDFNYALYFQNVGKVNDLELIENSFELKRSYDQAEEVSVPLKIFHSNFNFGIYENQIFAKEFENKVSFTENLNFLEDPSQSECVLMGSTDYEYNRLGKTLRFSQVISDIDNETSHLYFSIKGKTYLFNVSPSAFKTAKDAYGHMGIDIEVDLDSKVQSVDGIKNQLVANLHIENLKDNIFDKGRWEFISSSGSKVSEKLQAGERYVLSFRTLSELVNNTNFVQTKYKDKDLNGLVVSDSYVGDEILIFSELIARYNLPGQNTSYLKGSVKERYCSPEVPPRCDWSYRTDKKGCKLVESNENEDLLNYRLQKINNDHLHDFSLTIDKSKRVIKPIYKSLNGLYYLIKVKQGDIENQNVKIKIKNNQFPNKYPYRRKFIRSHVGAAKCFKKATTWFENRLSSKTYDLRATIIRRGVVR